MRNLKIILSIFVIFVMASSAMALQARLAQEDDIMLLKRDLLDGRIKIGSTRLMKIQEVYGDAANITRTERKLTYDYGDLKIDFDFKRYLRKWEYDYSHETAYSDDIESLRFDLEDQQIVGDFKTLREIRKDYDEPTEAYETTEDGARSVYYYGEIKLTFENYVVVRSWRGQKLDEASVYNSDVGSLIAAPKSDEPVN